MKRIATVKQTAEAYPAYSESSLRWLIFNAHNNGMEECLIRDGRRVRIDLDQFDERLESLRGRGRS